MTDLNDVVLIGRLTHDIGNNDFAYIASGTARLNVSIASNRSVKRGDDWADEVSYFDITIFGKTAENLKPYLCMGKQIAVKGYLKQERWQDKQTGNNRSRIHIVAEIVQLLGGKTGATDGGENEPESTRQMFKPRPQGQQQMPSIDKFPDEFPEDIPF